MAPFSFARDPVRVTAREIGDIRSEVNSTPYEGFFRGGIGENARVFDRRAGWMPQIVRATAPNPCAAADPLPKWCFEAACNTTFTRVKAEDGKCERDNCINLYR